MRIAIFSDNFYPELSGISDSTIVLAKELAKFGHYIDFYVPKYSKSNFQVANVPYKEIDLGENINVIRFSSFSFKAGTGQGRVVIPFGFRIFKILKNKPDIIHTQLFFGVGIEGLFASKVLRIPMVGTNHTALKEFLKYSPVRSSWLDNKILKYMNWYYECCELVTAPSQSIIDQMVDVGFAMNPPKLPTQIVPNPIDVPNSLQLDTRIINRKNLGLTGPTIIFAGRFASEKKIDILIESIKTVKESIPNVVLLLAGNGVIKDELVAQCESLGVKENVRFLGRLNKEELFKVYMASDIMATASTSEVQSISMLESMARGLPMVGVNAPGLKEHINDSNGRLAIPDNPTSLAEKIVEVLSDENLRESLSVGAISFAGQFSASSIAEDWQKIYQDVILNYRKRKGIK